ncbi:Rho GTPase-activating protein 26 [Varanus komodoensis]|nr:Rho GTPase-activating protein 26 [Varanus komodoensis]
MECAPQRAAQLDNVGFSIVKKCIHAVETRGINEQGLFRVVGVNSRVQKLLSILMDPKTAETEDEISAEWEIKTITSALKTYLRMLPGPLMMYQFQRSFIKAATPCIGPGLQLVATADDTGVLLYEHIYRSPSEPGCLALEQLKYLDYLQEQFHIEDITTVLLGELENQESRIAEIHSLVHRLPEKNRQMLHLLMNHLAK